MAKTSADSLLTVLNDILDFSKIEAGRLELESIPFSVRHCVAAAVNTLEFVAHEKGLQLSASVHPEVPDQLIGDPHRLRQVLLNLINNGVKFTKNRLGASAGALGGTTRRSCDRSIRRGGYRHRAFERTTEVYL